MTKKDQVNALITAHQARDERRFRATLLQMAAYAAHRNQHEQHTFLLRAAERSEQRIKDGDSGVAEPVLLVGGLQDLLAPTRPAIKLDDVVLDAEPMAKLRRVLEELRADERLRAIGLSSTRKLLLTGPSGTGKTMTAAALAGELGLPLFTVRIEALVGSHLGETGARLAKIFESMRTTRGVYLFDEFDSIGATRGGESHDVGEMRRVLNGLLTMLERDTSDSLIVATTNLPGLIDTALHRRFDVILGYQHCSTATIQKLIKRCFDRYAAGGLSVQISSMELAGIALVWAERGVISAAAVVRACDDTAKTVVLAGRDVMGVEDIVPSAEADADAVKPPLKVFHQPPQFA